MAKSTKSGIVVSKSWAAMEASAIAEATAKKYSLTDDQAVGISLALFEALMKGEDPKAVRNLAADLSAPLGAKNFAKRESTRKLRNGKFPVMQTLLEAYLEK